MITLSVEAKDISSFLDAQQIITAQAPAAGAEWTFTLPSGNGWLVCSARFRFVTSAAVATRVPRLILDDGTTEYFRSVPTGGITASQDQIYSTLPGGSALVQAGQVTLIPWPSPLPVCRTGHRVRVSTLSLDAADQYSAIALVLVDLDLLAELTGSPDSEAG